MCWVYFIVQLYFMEFGSLPKVLKQCSISTILVFVGRLVGSLLVILLKDFSYKAVVKIVRINSASLKINPFHVGSIGINPRRTPFFMGISLCCFGRFRRRLPAICSSRAWALSHASRSTIAGWWSEIKYCSTSPSFFLVLWVKQSKLMRRNLLQKNICGKESHLLRRKGVYFEHTHNWYRRCCGSPL